MSGAPEMSVIVLSYRGTERRLTGAARDAGVEAASAPFVAFLAADRLAAPGWVEGRLRRHRAGAAAVGTAVAPAEVSPVTRALWLYEHSGRLPLPDSGLIIQHGASDSRELIDRYGPFDDSELGEDTRFNIKLMAAGVEFEWAPDVVALHHYPTTLRGALSDCYARGQRKIRSRGTGFRPQARDPLLSFFRGVRRGLRAGSPVSRAQLGAALPLMAAYSAASYCGLSSGG